MEETPATMDAEAQSPAEIRLSDVQPEHARKVHFRFPYCRSHKPWCHAPDAALITPDISQVTCEACLGDKRLYHYLEELKRRQSKAAASAPPQRQQAPLVIESQSVVQSDNLSTTATAPADALSEQAPLLVEGQGAVPVEDAGTAEAVPVDVLPKRLPRVHFQSPYGRSNPCCQVTKNTLLLTRDISQVTCQRCRCDRLFLEHVETQKKRQAEAAAQKKDLETPPATAPKVVAGRSRKGSKTHFRQPYSDDPWCFYRSQMVTDDIAQVTCEVCLGDKRLNRHLKKLKEFHST